MVAGIFAVCKRREDSVPRARKEGTSPLAVGCLQHASLSTGPGGRDVFASY